MASFLYFLPLCLQSLAEELNAYLLKETFVLPRTKGRCGSCPWRSDNVMENTEKEKDIQSVCVRPGQGPGWDRQSWAATPEMS